MTPIDTLLTNCRKYANRTALVVDGRTVSYAELQQAVVVQSRRLAGQIQAGQRMALLCANTLEFITLSLAAEATGIIRVPLNIKATAFDIAVMLADCDPALVVYEKDTQPLLAEAVAVHADRADRVCRASQAGLVASPSVYDPCSITYTSGSTGKPKGVVMTHGNWHYVFANMLIERDIAENDTLGFIGPLTHAGWSYLYAGLLRGACAAIFPTGDVQGMLAYAEQHDITIVTCVPTTLARIIALAHTHHPLRQRLKWIGVGGAPSSPALLARAIQAFGQRIVLNYGQTEAMMTCAFCDLRREPDRAQTPGLIGRPYVYSEIRIMGSDGQVVPMGEMGEICVRGPHVMLEYWRAPTLTARVLRDGYVLTGDLGVEDGPGVFRLVGRTKDVIISGGFNVYPIEVEAVVAALDGIDEVCVLGLPSEEWGEAITCFFSTRDGSPRDVDGLRTLVKPRLGIKTPKAFHQLPVLPKTPNGKIDQQALRRGVKEMV